MSTLAECIQAFEARWNVDSAGLTPLGATINTIERLRDQLAALDADERGTIHEALCELLDELEDQEWAGLKADLAVLEG